MPEGKRGRKQFKTTSLIEQPKNEFNCKLQHFNLI